MGSEEDSGFDYSEPIVDELGEDMHMFHRAYRLVRLVEFFFAGVSIGMLIMFGFGDDMVPLIMYAIVMLPVCFALDQAKCALKLAINTEEERHEEMENYRKLSEMVCLREVGKGCGDGDGAGRRNP